MDEEKNEEWRSLPQGLRILDLEPIETVLIDVYTVE